MGMYVNDKRFGFVLLGALTFGIVTTGCQTTSEDNANAEPLSTEAPATVTPAPKTSLPVSLGSNPECSIFVAAKSPDAVADPCMTTEKFIQTISALSERQKRQALVMVAASTRLMQKIGARLAH